MINKIIVAFFILLTGICIGLIMYFDDGLFLIAYKSYFIGCYEQNTPASVCHTKALEYTKYMKKNINF